MGKTLDINHIDGAQSNKNLFIRIPSLSEFPELIHGFTTRHGGISSEEYATLNLNFNKADLKTNVFENFTRLSKKLAVPLEDMVLSHQVHDSKILPVSKEHSGMGIIKERCFSNIDGLATDCENLMLVTLYADCTPLYFYDPEKRVIALAHSGWRGTLLDIGGETVKLLRDKYGCDAQNLQVAFGPHIKKCCFEVDDDVAQMFFSTFEWACEFSSQRDDGKWVIDLQGIIIRSLLRYGVISRNISACNICTRCHNDIFFSYRGSNGKTGTGAAFMMIRG